MNGRGSRQKGQRGEREVAAIFTAAGIPMRRNYEGSVGQVTGDLDNEIELYGEVRRREALSIPAWIRELEEKKGDRMGVLIFRRSREPWHVTLSLDDFITLLLR